MIGIFDSGLGGLSVLASIANELPHADLVYLADTAHVPYGDRDDAFIRQRTLKIARHLADLGCTLIVVACNTATAAAVAALREALPGIPTGGVEPGVKPAVAASKSGRIVVLSTTSTARSERLSQLIRQFAGSVHFYAPERAEPLELAPRYDRMADLVAAPGGHTPVDGQRRASELRLLIQRANPRQTLRPPLPEPIGELLDEFTIRPGSARDYRVGAGQYIQVIDVAGRQCSDFVAFDRRGLDAGHQIDLDPTVTRTLNGHAYPGPGLFSRFFDRNMQPMLEVVRDTVGRHDTFAQACTARYYESQGYFGHANCSDNISRALAGRACTPARAGRRSTSSSTPPSTPTSSSPSTSPGHAPATTCCCAP